MNAILFAFVSFLETVATYAAGATLIVLGAVCVIAGSRWLLSESDRGYTGGAAVLRHGSGSLALVGALSLGLTTVVAGLLVWSR